MFDPSGLGYQWFSEWLRAPALIGPRKAILIVEDDDFMRPFLSKTIESLSSSLDILWARDADAARGYFYERVPNIVIADCLLGRGDSGVKIWQEFKVKSPDLPFLLMSGLSEETVKRFLGNPDERLPPLLKKPFTGSELKHIVFPMLAR